MEINEVSNFISSDLINLLIRTIFEVDDDVRQVLPSLIRVVDDGLVEFRVDIPEVVEKSFLGNNRDLKDM